MSTHLAFLWKSSSQVPTVEVNIEQWEHDIVSRGQKNRNTSMLETFHKGSKHIPVRKANPTVNGGYKVRKRNK